MAVVAGLDDPLAVFATYDFSDVVRPNDNGSNSRCSRPTPMCPVARQIECRPRVGADEMSHFPAAPRGRASAVVATIGRPCLKGGISRRREGKDPTCWS